MRIFLHKPLNRSILPKIRANICRLLRFEKLEAILELHDRSLKR